jgi:hypothetical protein
MLLLISQPLESLTTLTAAERRQEEDSDKEIRQEYNRVTSILKTWCGDYSFSIGRERVSTPSSPFQDKDGRIKGRCRCEYGMERQGTVINVKITTKKNYTINDI